MKHRWSSTIKGILSLSLFSLLIVVFSVAIAADIYKWIDENGSIHFSDSTANVPAKYRSQVSKIDLRNKNESPDKSKAIERKDGSNDSSPGKKGSPKKISIPYKAYEGSARRIIIPVKINDRVTVPMLLDTVAPGTIIFFQLAFRLKLFERDEGWLFTEVSGIGGTIPAIRSIIDTVQVGTAKNHFIPVTIVPPVSDEFEGIIGMDFMMNHLIQIDPSQEILIFEELPPNSNLVGGRDEQWWRTTFSEFDTYRTVWKERRDTVKKQLRKSSLGDGFVRERAMRFVQRADYQHNEADKLLSKLKRFARKFAVPMHWRRHKR